MIRKQYEPLMNRLEEYMRLCAEDLDLNPRMEISAGIPQLLLPLSSALAARLYLLPASELGDYATMKVLTIFSLPGCSRTTLLSLCAKHNRLTNCAAAFLSAEYPEAISLCGTLLSLSAMDADSVIAFLRQYRISAALLAGLIDQRADVQIL